MTCKNALRKPGYWILVRNYLPSGQYLLEPEYIKDTSSWTKCECCNDPKRVYVEIE